MSTYFFTTFVEHVEISRIFVNVWALHLVILTGSEGLPGGFDLWLELITDD